MSETDGIDDALDGQVRLALITAARIGGEIAAGLAERMREQQRRDEQAARELESRHAAERRAAEAELAQVHRPGWWAQADVNDVGNAYQTAVAWQHDSPAAAAAAQRMRAEVRDRFGIDVDDVARAAADRAAAQQAAQAAEPTFSVGYYDGDGNPRSHTISKSEALAAVANLPDTTTVSFSSTRGSGWNTTGSATVGSDDVLSWTGKDPVVDWAIATRYPDRIAEDDLARVREHVANETPDQQAERWQAAGMLARVEAERTWWDSLSPDEQAQQYEPNPAFERGFPVDPQQRKPIDWNAPEWQQRVQDVLDSYDIGQPPTAQDAAPAETPRQAAQREQAAAERDGDRYQALLAEQIGQDQAGTIRDMGAWPALVTQLQQAEEAGHDARNLLREITVDYGREMGLGDGRDKAALLQWRAEHRMDDRAPENTGEPATPAEAGEEAKQTERREQAEADAMTAAVVNTEARDRAAAIHAEAWEWWNGQKANETWASDYMTGRGLAEAEWAVAPDSWSGLTDHLTGRGWTTDQLVEAGVTKETINGNTIDVFRDRVLFPIRDNQGDIVAISGRINPASADGNENYVPPKYLNTPATPAYDKSSTLIGLDPDAAARLADGARPMLVEGPTDRAAMLLAGHDDVVPLASAGTAVTEQHLQAVRDAAGRDLSDLIVALDADQAGQMAAGRVWEKLTDHEARGADALVMPDGQDPAQLLADGRRDDLAARVEETTPLTRAVIAPNVEAISESEFFEQQIPVLQGLAEKVHDRDRDYNGLMADVAQRIGNAPGDRHLDAAGAYRIMSEAVDNPASPTGTATGQATEEDRWAAAWDDPKIHLTPVDVPATIEDLTRGKSEAEVQDFREQLRGMGDGELSQFGATSGLDREQLRSFSDNLPTPAATPAGTEPAETGPRWDSPERRQAEAAAMADKGLDPEAIATRMRADVGTAGAPAAEATAGAGQASQAPVASVNRSHEQEATQAPAAEQ